MCENGIMVTVLKEESLSFGDTYQYINKGISGVCFKMTLEGKK